MLFGFTRASATAKQEPPKLTKNGKINPSLIPDWVAYEFFFKSLVTSPSEGDRGQGRIKSFVKQTGIKISQIEPLLAEASRIYQRISGFDRQVKSIKDQNWPDPEPQVWDQLKEIQEEKETAIIEQSKAFLTRQGTEVGGNLRSFINDHVKRHIKGYASRPNPGQELRSYHTVRMNFATVSPLLFASMQMQGDETVYIYANASYTPGDDFVYGYGDVSATASSYGHEYSMRSEFQSPCNEVLPGGAAYLDGCDGLYAFFVVAVQSCPIANTIADAASNESDVSVSPYVRVVGFGSFNPTSVIEGTPIFFGATSNISLTFRASTNANTTVSVEGSYQLTNGSPPVTVHGALTDVGGSFNISGGQTIAKSMQYYAPSITTNPTKIKAEALITASVLVLNNIPRSTSKLTISK